jgi:hypothetical protein
MATFDYSNNIAVRMGGGTEADLLCPRCQSPNLHHSKVVAFNRAEDDANLIVTTIEGKRTVTEELPSDKSSNPSSRRDGLSIRFWCESCGGQSDDEIIELIIAQHKGFTEIGWRFMPIVKR